MSKDIDTAWGGWRRPVLIVLATAPIGAIALSLAWMARSEAAFDEASCPYREDGEVREVADGVALREDVRRCVDGVEEHRWVLLREGAEPLAIGRRRLDSARFASPYAWSATLDDDGRVRLVIRNPGMAPRTFREPSPDGPNGRTPPR
ncbi:MAG: hypothetical protein ACFCGT_15965 [Sandaracinaceae bacterium]